AAAGGPRPACPDHLAPVCRRRTSARSFPPGRPRESGAIGTSLLGRRCALQRRSSRRCRSLAPWARERPPATWPSGTSEGGDPGGRPENLPGPGNGAGRATNGARVDWPGPSRVGVAGPALCRGDAGTDGIWPGPGPVAARGRGGRCRECQLGRGRRGGGGPSAGGGGGAPLPAGGGGGGVFPPSRRAGRRGGSGPGGGRGCPLSCGRGGGGGGGGPRGAPAAPCMRCGGGRGGRPAATG